MKTTSYLFSVLISLIALNANAQFWIENFVPTNTIANGSANGYTSSNGTWIETILLGDSGVYPNRFYVSCQEAGMVVNNCGDICPPVPLPPPNPYLGQCLHISSTIMADNGAIYVETGSGNQCNSELRIESPIINCTGIADLVLNFNYIENGNLDNDNADVWYFDGLNWSFLFETNKTMCGDGVGGPCNQVPCSGFNQGYWTASPGINLPISANNNPNVKIGFRWINNDDGVGTDPSIAITNITLANNATVNQTNLNFNGTISVSPNPTNADVGISLYCPRSQTANIALYDCLGQMISNENVNFLQGQNLRNISLEQLNGGVYYIRLTGIGLNYVKQIIKTQ